MNFGFRVVGSSPIVLPRKLNYKQMVEQKISLTLLVPGKSKRSLQVCNKNPKRSHKVTQVEEEEKVVTIKSYNRDNVISQSMNLCVDAYKAMLSTPTHPKYNKPVKYNRRGEVIARVWDIMSIDARLKLHFDQIAHDLGAVAYSYEVLGD